MFFTPNYFVFKMTGNKVKVNTDKTEFNVNVKNGKATFTVQPEPTVEAVAVEEVTAEDAKPAKETKKK